MKKAIVIIAIVAVLGVAGFFGYRAYTSSQSTTTANVTTATITRGSVATTLSSSGNTRSAQNATIVWKTSGQVGEITLNVGDLVEKDQVLAALDPNTLSADLMQAKQNLITARQNLEDLKNSTVKAATAQQAVEEAQTALDNLQTTDSQAIADAQQAVVTAQTALEDAQQARDYLNYPKTTDPLIIEKAQTAYQVAKQNYKKALNDYNQVANKRLTDPQRVNALNRLVSAEQAMQSALTTYNWYLLPYASDDITAADAALDVAKANLATAQQKLEDLKAGSSSAEVALASARLADAQREWERLKDGPTQDDIDAAQFAVDQAQADLDNAQLLAPFGGTITKVNVKTGDLVNAGDTAYRVDDLSAIYIDLSISEVDLASLQVGQEAVVEFDAIADKTYTGVVTDIGMVASVSQGVVTYPVTVQIKDADSSIRTGLTASVTITTAQASDVLVVPNKAIKTSAGQKSVTVLYEGQQITVPVTVGLAGDSMTEIISEQLKEGDTVVLTGSTASTTSNNNQQFQGGFEIRNDMMPPGGMP